MKPPFNDLATAYSCKSTWDLKKANFIFSVVNHPILCSLMTTAVKICFKLRIPIDVFVRKTVFEHFCGGESITRSAGITSRIADAGVETILDYSAEGEKTEPAFSNTMREILCTIENAGARKHFPFAVFKITGIASADLLERIQSGKQLSNDDQDAWRRAKARIQTICRSGALYRVPVLIDAEESWIQGTIDLLAQNLMEQFNRKRIIVFNTYQLYRTDAITNLKSAMERATIKGYSLGVKLVRGAYMEKERARAKSKNLPCLIQPTAKHTDEAFNEALEFCVANIDRISMVCGSHNESSTIYLTELMAKARIQNNDQRIWFSQLYGMSDHISFNMAKEGYNVAKYLPYGPIRLVMPYLLRRADENTSVAGQSNRELHLIRTELRRRKQMVEQTV